MGKGDARTEKGKRWRHSHGNSRPKKGKSGNSKRSERARWADLLPSSRRLTPRVRRKKVKK